MRVRDALPSARIDRADAEILLSFLLGKDRVWLLTHPDEEIPPGNVRAYAALCRRRRSGEPLAYITGTREFYGRPFSVNPSILIPRPATELLVEQAVSLLRGDIVDPVREADAGIVVLSQNWKDAQTARTVVDIGTGSGCIAVSLAHALPSLSIIATDVSDAALDTARLNARAHGVHGRMRFRSGSLLDPVSGLDMPFLLVSNPPYIPAGTPLPQDVAAFEPAEALFAGTDGMDVLRPLVLGSRRHPACVGFVLECRTEQAPLLVTPPTSTSS